MISKLAERAVQGQILKYLEETGQISNNHHAYRMKYSTTMTLIQIMDAVADATHKNLITASISIDLSAAFDCVCHNTLRQKLQYYGLDNNTLKWIDSYLAYRSSFVAIGSAVSSIRTTKYGVPQGSVLGPLLYLIYINEMTTILEDNLCTNQVHKDSVRIFPMNCRNCGEFTVFADDGQYLTATNDRFRKQVRIEESFLKIRDYLNANGLMVNEAKTILTEFMTRQKRMRTKSIPPHLTVKEKIKDRSGQVRLEDKLIDGSPVCRMLGVNLLNNFI